MVRRLRDVEKHYARLFEHAPGLDASAGSLVFTGVVDDPDLGVNVQRAPEPAAEGRDRRSQKALGAVICGCQDAELHAGRVGAVVGPCGERCMLAADEGTGSGACLVWAGGSGT